MMMMNEYLFPGDLKVDLYVMSNINSRISDTVSNCMLMDKPQ